MSDEPKKRRSRGWIGWALLAVLVLYPLSMGPAFRWASSSGDPITDMERMERVGSAYEPIVWLNVHFKWFCSAMSWYVDLWQPDP